MKNQLEKYVNESVLCWLATSNQENEPNVSPKEMFVLKDEQTLVIANIASPVSQKNIQQNPKICVSMVNVFTQKGLKIKGLAKDVLPTDENYQMLRTLFQDTLPEKFVVKSFFEIKIKEIKAILAPSYLLFPETTEESQIVEAYKTYNIK